MSSWANDVSFEDTIRALLTELDTLLPEIQQRLQDEQWILEVCDWLNAEYKKLGDTPEAQQRDQTKVAQIEALHAPKQEHINKIYKTENPKTAKRVTEFINRVQDCLNATPLRYEMARTVRAEIERLSTYVEGGASWKRSRVDLITIRSRLHEILASIETQSAQAAASAAGGEPPRPDPQPQKQKQNIDPPRKIRGAPQKIGDDLKRQALTAKAQGKSNSHCATILYRTKHPSTQQTKNVSSILRHFKKKQAVRNE